MSINNVRKILFSCTALVAVASFSTEVRAATATLTTGTTWASAGTHLSTTNDGTDASANDAVDTNGFALTISNNQTANDSSGLNTFNVGAVTDVTGTGSVVVTNGSANDITTTIASVSQTSTGSFQVDNSTALTSANTATVTSDLTEGTLTLINGDTTTAKAVDLTIGGNTTLTGGTGVAVTAGTFAGANSVLTLNGGTDDLVAVTLTDGGIGNSTGLAKLVIGGTGVAAVSGTIDGGLSGEGTLDITNTAGAAFAGAIGGLSPLREVDAGVTGTTTTFNALVHTAVLDITGTGTVDLGAQTLTGNVNFEGHNGFVTLSTGTITGNISTTTNNTGTVTITNAGTITGTVGSAGDSIQALNAGTTGTTTITGDIHATTLNVTGTGTVALGGTLTGALAFGTNDGVVTLASGKSITGAVTATGGVGTLTLSGTSTVGGNIGNLKVLTAGQAGDTSTLSGTVNATTINVGTGIAAFGDTVTGIVDLGGNNGTINVASGKSIVGAVDSTGSSSGVLTLLGGTQDISGTVGATNPLTTVNAGLSGGATTFGGLVQATTLSIGTGSATLDGGFTGTAANFTEDGTLHLAAGQTLAGAVTTSTAGTGTFVFDGNGTVSTTLGAGNALKALTVNGSGTTGTVTGNLAAANTTNVNGNTLATSGSFTMGATQTLDATVTGAAANGVVTAATATIAHGATLDISMSSAYAPAINYSHTYEFVTAGGGSVDPALTIHGSPIFTFTQVVNGSNLDVTVLRNAIVTQSSTSNNNAVAAALDAIGSTGTAPLTAVQGDINAASSKTALNNILSSLTPTVDGGAQAGVLEAGIEVENIADTRMAALRADDGTSGIAAGSSANGNSVWVQGYGQTATQSERNDIAGYGSKTWGTAIGMDTSNMAYGGILGLMMNYGQIKVDSKNINTTSTGVDGYGINLYGTVPLVEQMFFEGQIGYGYNKINSDRHNVGASGITASGNTNSSQYDARAELGRDFSIGYGTTFTPDVSTTYNHLSTKGYQETGSGANLNVGANSQNALDFGVGAQIAWNLKGYDGTLMKPTVHASYSYAAIADRIETTSTFEGATGGTDPSFTTTGPTPERNRFDVGAGITYMTMANWDMSANYNYEYRPDYTAQSGILRVTSHF